MVGCVARVHARDPRGCAFFAWLDQPIPSTPQPRCGHDVPAKPVVVGPNGKPWNRGRPFWCCHVPRSHGGCEHFFQWGDSTVPLRPQMPPPSIEPELNEFEVPAPVPPEIPPPFRANRDGPDSDDEILLEGALEELRTVSAEARLNPVLKNARLSNNRGLSGRTERFSLL